MMIHPASVHFAMVLPVAAATFGLIYLTTKKEGMSKIAARTTLVAALAMIVAWYTGNQAGPEIFNYLSKEGKEELLEHKSLGLYLAIAMGIIALIQIAGCRLKKFGLEALAIILLIGTMTVTFLQGKHGGEIVYNHGMPFKAYKIESTLKKAVATAEESEEDDGKVEVYEDAIDDIDAISEEADAIYGNSHEEDEE